MQPALLKLLVLLVLIFALCGAEFAVAGDLSNGSLIPLKDFEGIPKKSILDTLKSKLPGTRIETQGGVTDWHFHGSVTAIQPLWFSVDNTHHVFAQATWSRSSDDKYADTLSTGIAYRHLNDSKSVLFGANIFLDHGYKRDHNRLGIGIDGKTKYLGFALNRYQSLSGWKDVNKIYEERALSGWDAELRGQITNLPNWTLLTKAYTWDNYDGDDIYGYTAGVEYSPVDLVAFNLGMRDENNESVSAEAFMRLKWRFDRSLKEQTKLRKEIIPVADAVYDTVQRENQIRVARRVKEGALDDRTSPSGYSVAFTTDPVTPANHTAAAFLLSSGEAGAAYSYTITSSGGGLSLSGSGTLASDTQNFSNIDTSAMQDGTLTITITLTDINGNVGAPVQDTVIKNARFLCGQAGENGVINLAAPAGEVFTSVDFASYGTPNGTCGNYTVGACNAINSVPITSSTFVGNNSGNQPATNGIFGDPCGGTLKRMYVQLRY